MSTIIQRRSFYVARTHYRCIDAFLKPVSGNDLWISCRVLLMGH